MTPRKLSCDYIRGLVDGEGTFTFCTTGEWNKKSKVPAFQLRMHIRDKELIETIRNFLGLRNKVYIYHYPGKDGASRGPQAMLIVREFNNLKDIIIPLFYKKLFGYKGIQFTEWLEKIGSDPDVSDRFKSLYRLYRWGMYDKLPKFTEKFKD
ncbi:LAGLIDADG family homing endonuclease [Candidatus Wolfebacteria bacterium]|nr:LAGLIDADG family homing endonuclease [Candidatus Wolfebacteria bacterium]